MPGGKLLPHDPVQRWLYVGFLFVLVGSCIAPPYADYLLMQHALTVLAAIVLPYAVNRLPISRWSFASIVCFLCLHTIGARYLYSYVPYDAWSEQLLGVRITDVFGFERNHYDRLVHFSYGLLLAVPIQEIERRHLRLSPGLASALAIECILATSAAYELIEWLVTLVFAPDWADQFLGQQGDMFDAQKDMALATGGACLSIALLSVISARKRPPRAGVHRVVS